MINEVKGNASDSSGCLRHFIKTLCHSVQVASSGVVAGDLIDEICIITELIEN